MEKKQAILVPMIALRGMSIFPGMTYRETLADWQLPEE